MATSRGEGEWQRVRGEWQRVPFRRIHPFHGYTHPMFSSKGGPESCKLGYDGKNTIAWDCGAGKKNTWKRWIVGGKKQMEPIETWKKGLVHADTAGRRG